MSDLADWITPAQTAVLVVDMQADFASPGGVMGRSGADLASVPGALAAAERLVAAARGAGVPVVFAGLQTTARTDSSAWLERMRRLGAAIDEGVCREGQSGAAFVGPTPAPGETVIAKSRYSAFFNTDLDERLQARGIDTLIVCGLTTECCVDCTVRDAFHLDYQVFISGDACAAYEPDLHAGALKAMALNYAIVVDVDAVTAAWSDDGQT